MARRREVKIHKVLESGEEFTGFCAPSALKVYERHGWTAVDDGDSETDLETPSGADDPQETNDHPVVASENEE